MIPILPILDYFYVAMAVFTYWHIRKSVKDMNEMKDVWGMIAIGFAAAVWPAAWAGYFFSKWVD